MLQHTEGGCVVSMHPHLQSRFVTTELPLPAAHPPFFSTLDTAGQEDYDAFTKQYFRRAQGILLTYDITNHKSFDNLTKWVQKLKQNVPQSEDAKVPIVLLGNKVDLDDQRVVNTSEGLEFAQLHNMSFFETSCVTALNITDAIFALAESILTEISPVEEEPIYTVQFGQVSGNFTERRLNCVSHHQTLLLSTSGSTMGEECGCGKCFC
ncbi:ras-related protein Rab-10-like isoform X2 [Dysidea avara]|uniref:ras-related protein Rab-10-like isoform X2 n=1 Tax=Dysidea avara TaxID=196820 RepID=UPI00331EFB6B